MADDSKPNISEPILESPPDSEFPGGKIDGLFNDESVASNMAKFAVVESFLKLLTRDYRYSDFSRELLLAIMRVVRSEAGSLFEVDHKNNTLFFRSIVGQSSDQLDKFVIPMGKGVVGHVAESRQPCLVNDISENKLHLKAVQNAVGFQTKNLIALPIVIRGRIYGVLELLNRVGEDGFTSNDQELLTYFCEMAAKAIEVRLMIAWAAGSSRNSDQGGEAA